MSIRACLQKMTKSSYEEKLRKSVSEKVSDILTQAEKVAKSGENIFFIEIDTPSQEVISELRSIGLDVNVDRERSTVSWWERP